MSARLHYSLFVSNCEAEWLRQPQTCARTCASSCANTLHTSRLHVPEKTINLEQKRGDPCIQSEEFLLSLISHVQNRRTFMHLGHMFA